MIPGLKVIEKNISEKFANHLDKVGLLYRLFSRVKSEDSIREKIYRKEAEGKAYSINGKLIQDSIGIRIVTYFKDDIDLVKAILEHKCKFLDEEIDTHGLTVFKPKRTNIICGFSIEETTILKEIQNASQNSDLKLLDTTFELQLRTILSEGWHEIDHSLRYKCKSDWDGHVESERLLNGIYASFETNDIALKNLFNELAYKHFKNKNWEGLIRNKFRLKFQLLPLREELKAILNKNPDLGKRLVKLDRHEILLALYKLEISLPVNLNNIVYLVNAVYLDDKEIWNLTPKLIKTYFNDFLKDNALIKIRKNL